MSVLAFSHGSDQSARAGYFRNVAKATRGLLGAVFPVRAQFDASVDSSLAGHSEAALVLNQMANELETTMPSLASEFRLIAARA
ncbi:MAG: hypothetical protein ACTHL1_04275 [Burkholderiaceae bacterium]